MANINAPILKSRNWPRPVLETTIQPYSNSKQVQMIWTVKWQLNPLKKNGLELVILTPRPLQHILPECKTQQGKHWSLQFCVCYLVYIVSWHELPWALAAQGLSFCHFQPTHTSSFLGSLRPVTYNYPPQMSYVWAPAASWDLQCSFDFRLYWSATQHPLRASLQGIWLLPHIVSQAVLWGLTKSLHDFRRSIPLVCWQLEQWMSPIGPWLQQPPRAWVAGCVKAPCRHFLVSRITQWLPLLKGNSRTA